MMLYDDQIFEHRGRRFRFNEPDDITMGEPWNEHDGHGVVSEWSSRVWRSGELLLNSDRYSYRYYDFRESMALAKQDGWGCELTEDNMRDAIRVLQELADHDRQLVEDGELDADDAVAFDPAEIETIKLAVAVNADFEYLRGWCNNDWTWVGVVVTHITTDEYGDDIDGEERSLWGIESSDRDYIETTARELADEIGGDLDDIAVAEIEASRPDLCMVEA